MVGPVDALNAFFAQIAQGVVLIDVECKEKESGKGEVRGHVVVRCCWLLMFQLDVGEL